MQKGRQRGGTIVSDTAICGKEKKHFGEIDICRGLGIVLVVLGHALKQTGESNRGFSILLSVIYSFHMPLFFFLSGFVAIKILTFKEWTQCWKFVKDRAFRLLIPYFTVGILYIPFKYFLSGYAVQKYDFSQMWRIFAGENPNTALWYLYVLFFVSVICAFVVREKNLRIWLAVSFCCCAAAYCLDSPFRLPKYCFFFILGIFIRSNYEKYTTALADIRLFWIAFAGFVAANFIMEKMQINALCVITALTGILCSLMLSVRMEKSGKGMQRSFSFLGKNSMDIYILSEPFHTAAKILFWNLLHWNYIICTVLCFISGILLPIPVSKYIIRKIKVLRIAFLGERTVVK